MTTREVEITHRERLLEPILLGIALRESAAIYRKVGKSYAARFALSSSVIRRGRQVLYVGLPSAMATDLGTTLGVMGAAIVLISILRNDLLPLLNKKKA